MKRKQFVSAVAVLARLFVKGGLASWAALKILAVEQGLGSGRDRSLANPEMPMLAFSIFLAIYGIMILIGISIYLCSSIRQRLKKRRPSPDQENPVEAESMDDSWGEQARDGQPKRVGGLLKRTTRARSEQVADILLLDNNPAAASSAVKELAQQPNPEAVDTLISALGYCQSCQVGKGPAQRIPNEFVRLAAARALGKFSHSAFRDLAQIMRAMEAVSQEAGRKEEEATNNGRVAGENPYYAGLKEVLNSLFGRLQFCLAQLPPGADSEAQIREELRRYETGDGQLVSEQFAQDPIYVALKAKLLALSGSLRKVVINHLD